VKKVLQVLQNYNEGSALILDFLKKRGLPLIRVLVVAKLLNHPLAGLKSPYIKPNLLFRQSMSKRVLASVGL